MSLYMFLLVRRVAGRGYHDSYIVLRGLLDCNFGQNGAGHLERYKYWTYWDGDKMVAISQTVLSIHFLAPTLLKDVPMAPINNTPALVQKLAWRRIQYIPRNMHTVFVLLCFVVVIHWLIFPYPSGLLHWHCGNLTIAPVPAKQPWWIWINTSCEFIMNDCITTKKQSTTKPCAYFLGYTLGVNRLTYQISARFTDILLLFRHDELSTVIY